MEVNRTAPMAQSLGPVAFPAIRAARRQRTRAASPALNAPAGLALPRVSAPAGSLSSASARTPQSTRSISILETAAIHRAPARPQPTSARAAGKGPSVTLVVDHWLPRRPARPSTLAFALQRMAVQMGAASGSSVFLAFKVGGRPCPRASCGRRGRRHLLLHPERVRRRPPLRHTRRESKGRCPLRTDDGEMTATSTRRITATPNSHQPLDSWPSPTRGPSAGTSKM
jgi:hypothetical protein